MSWWPVLDLKGKLVNGVYNKGCSRIVSDWRYYEHHYGKRWPSKNLYDPGTRFLIIKSTQHFFSALGEDDKITGAETIQMFMPGIPQVWYLDIFAGKMIGSW
jgi:sucrose phosphorylase